MVQASLWLVRRVGFTVKGTLGFRDLGFRVEGIWGLLKTRALGTAVKAREYARVSG